MSHMPFNLQSSICTWHRAGAALITKKWLNFDHAMAITIDVAPSLSFRQIYLFKFAKRFNVTL